MSSNSPPVLGGRYEFVRRLARGGMASVFLARDLQLNRHVAIKMLHPQFAADESFAERFRREAQAAAKLSHHNIVAIYDWGRQGDNYFIVMEYVEGQSLSELLAQRGRLDANSALGVGIGVASALSFAHRSGIVHRDIKPGNVLISSQGHVKVVDFGISTVVGGSQSSLTQAGTILGTAAYLSPEQARGESVDTRSDLYSLGVVLYEAMTGRPPFKGDSSASLAYQHVRSVPPPLSDLGVYVPDELESATMRLLAKAPDDRYERAEELFEHLRYIREKARNEPSARPPFSSYERSGDSRSRNQRPSGSRRRESSPGTVQRQQRRHAPTEYLRAARQPPGYSQKGKKPRSRRGDTTVIMERQRRSGMFYVGFATLLIALVVLIVVLINVLSGDDSSNDVAVSLADIPSVFQLSEEEAVRLIENAGFRVVTESLPSTAVDKGLVSSQDPKGGSRADAGSVVTLTISSGAGTILVPNVVGVPASTALNTLRGLGLSGETISVASDSPQGEVVDQEPPSGERLELGSDVYLDVSTGPRDVFIPGVEGRDEFGAVADLVAAGFIVERRREFSEFVAEGMAIRTDPQKGTPHEPGGQVFLYISEGPEEVVMPDVRNLELRAATFRLDQLYCAGCYTVEERLVSETNLVGVVLEQIPAPGSVLQPEWQIVIYVGALTEDTPVAPTEPDGEFLPDATPSDIEENPSVNSGDSSTTSSTVAN